MDNDENLEEDQIPDLRRSTRVANNPSTYIPSFEGQKYEEINSLNIHVLETLEYDSSFAQVFVKTINDYMFKQSGLKKGLQVLGEDGRQAAMKEMEPLHLR